MLKFNPKRILGLRGIGKPVGFLVRMGFDYPQASRFLKAASPSVKIKHIEQLCIALNCTPNDLFEWKSDGEKILADGHSLNVLNRGEGTKNLQEMVKDVPSDKLALIEDLLDALKP